MKKLFAIFGGTFDPIHYGHIHLAEKLAIENSITKIIILPNKIPHNKKCTETSIIDRLNMIKLAIYKNNLFDLSYLEVKKKLHYKYFKNHSSKNRLFKISMFYYRRR